MANGTVDPAALKAECVADSTALGLAAPFAAGSLNSVAALLNATKAAIRVDRDYVASYEVFEAIVSSEWTALSAANKQLLQTLLACNPVYAKGPNTRAAFLAIFAAGTATRTNLAALQTRDGSRAEQLFGRLVTVADVEAAKAV